MCWPLSANAGSTNLGGARVSCYAAKTIIKDKRVPGPGYASQGVIYLGPQYLKAYPPVVQRFIFLHECGHQYVGVDETGADCWAAKIGKRQGWFSQAGVASVCKAFWNTQGGQYHLPGPQRCEALKQCFADAPGRSYAVKSRKVSAFQAGKTPKKAKKYKKKRKKQ
ncbi:MAG: hypothetical protein R3D57_01160 [Hyphomicrobiaceae bacterium]